MNFISLLLSFLFGILTMYLTAYTKEKGKVKALREDVAKIEDEKQKVISKYQKEIEDLKKFHSLDIEKRKYQYESKKTQYYQFMEKIDSYNGCLLRVLTEEFSQIMLSYFASCNGVSSSSPEKLTLEFNEKAQKAIAKIQKQEAELFSQLNSLKLSANAEIITLLEKLVFDIKYSKKHLEDVLNYIGSNNFKFSPSVPEELLSKSDNNQHNILETKEKLMNALRLDLDKI